MTERDRRNNLDRKNREIKKLEKTKNEMPKISVKRDFETNYEFCSQNKTESEHKKQIRLSKKNLFVTKNALLI